MFHNVEYTDELESWWNALSVRTHDEVSWVDKDRLDRLRDRIGGHARTREELVAALGSARRPRDLHRVMDRAAHRRAARCVRPRHPGEAGRGDHASDGRPQHRRGRVGHQGRTSAAMRYDRLFRSRKP